MIDRNLCSRRRLLGTGLAAAAALSGFRTSPARAAGFQLVNPGALTVAALGELPASGLDNGKLIGTDGEIMSAIAAKLGIPVQPLILDNAATIESVRSGRSDVMLGNMRWTEKRAEVMALTDAVYYVTYGAVTRKDSKLPDTITIADLNGASLGTLTGASASADLKKVPGNAGVRFYDSSEAALRDIIANRLDFAILDPTLIAYSVSKDPSLNLKHVVFKPDPGFATLTNRSQTVFGMRLENPDLLDAVNAGVKWMWQTKQTQKIFAKYGLTEPTYFEPLATDPRIGVDRDASGRVLGPAAHQPKDYSGLFA
jgi:polar amino acid transport system substrate-binding protein